MLRVVLTEGRRTGGRKSYGSRPDGMLMTHRRDGTGPGTEIARSVSTVGRLAGVATGAIRVSGCRSRGNDAAIVPCVRTALMPSKGAERMRSLDSLQLGANSSPLAMPTVEVETRI